MQGRNPEGKNNIKWVGCIRELRSREQEDGMGRQEGGGFRMGSTCIPAADSFRCLAKLIYCKV